MTLTLYGRDKATAPSDAWSDDSSSTCDLLRWQPHLLRRRDSATLSLKRGRGCSSALQPLREPLAVAADSSQRTRPPILGAVDRSWRGALVAARPVGARDQRLEDAGLFRS